MIFLMQDNVLTVSISWSGVRQNNYYLISSRGIMSSCIICRSEAQGNCALLILIHIPCQLKSLLVLVNSRMVTSIKHVLQSRHSRTVQKGVIPTLHTMVECCVRV